MDAQDVCASFDSVVGWLAGGWDGCGEVEGWDGEERGGARGRREGTRDKGDGKLTLEGGTRFSGLSYRVAGGRDRGCRDGWLPLSP